MLLFFCDNIAGLNKYLVVLTPLDIAPWDYLKREQLTEVIVISRIHAAHQNGKMATLIIRSFFLVVYTTHPK